MIKDKIFHEIEPANDRALYVSVTQRCQLNCPFCFNHFVEGFKNEKEVTVDEIVKTIKEGNYSNIDFLGGEPLLKPQIMIDVMEHFKDKRKLMMWGTSSNLAFKKLSDLQIKALQMMQDLSCARITLGSSYNIDRFESQNYYDLWIKNMQYLDSIGLNIGITLTVTEKQSKESVDTLLKVLDESKAKAVNIERCLYPKPKNDFEKKQLEEKYKSIDEYIMNCFKKIPIEKNYQFARYYNGIVNRTPIFNNHCSHSISMLYPEPTGLVHGCVANGNDNSEEVYKNKIIDNDCLICDFYDYCRGDCECNRGCCAFPKKTVSYVRELIWRDYK